MIDSIPHEIKLVFMAMSPVVELRGAILYGLIRQINPFVCFLLGVLGSTLLVPILLKLLRPFVSYVSRLKFIGPFFQRIENKAVHKSKKINRYRFWGLAIFVGIPLPGTGAWTGCLVANILKMSIRDAFFSIFIGNIIAGIIVLLISHGSISLFDLIK